MDTCIKFILNENVEYSDTYNGEKKIFLSGVEYTYTLTDDNHIYLRDKNWLYFKKIDFTLAEYNSMVSLPSGSLELWFPFTSHLNCDSYDVFFFADEIIYPSHDDNIFFNNILLYNMSYQNNNKILLYNSTWQGKSVTNYSPPYGLFISNNCNIINTTSEKFIDIDRYSDNNESYIRTIPITSYEEELPQTFSNIFDTRYTILEYLPFLKKLPANYDFGSSYKEGFNNPNITNNLINSPFLEVTNCEFYINKYFDEHTNLNKYYLNYNLVNTTLPPFKQDLNIVIENFGFLTELDLTDKPCNTKLFLTLYYCNALQNIKLPESNILKTVILEINNCPNLINFDFSQYDYDISIKFYDDLEIDTVIKCKQFNVTTSGRETITFEYV